MDPFWRIKPKDRSPERTNQDIEFLTNKLIKAKEEIFDEENPYLRNEKIRRLEELNERLVLLNKRQMMVYKLRLIEKMTYRQIAKHMKISAFGAYKIFRKVKEIICNERGA